MQMIKLIISMVSPHFHISDLTTGAAHLEPLFWVNKVRLLQCRSLRVVLKILKPLIQTFVER